jgi:hypothetical protein
VATQKGWAARGLLGGEGQHLAVELEDTDTLLQEGGLAGPRFQQAPVARVSRYREGDPWQTCARTDVDGRARRQGIHHRKGEQRIGDVPLLETGKVPRRDQIEPRRPSPHKRRVLGQLSFLLRSH